MYVVCVCFILSKKSSVSLVVFFFGLWDPYPLRDHLPLLHIFSLSFIAWICDFFFIESFILVVCLCWGDMFHASQSWHITPLFMVRLWQFLFFLSAFRDNLFLLVCVLLVCVCISYVCICMFLVRSCLEKKKKEKKRKRDSLMMTVLTFFFSVCFRSPALFVWLKWRLKLKEEK